MLPVSSLMQQGQALPLYQLSCAALNRLGLAARGLATAADTGKLSSVFLSDASGGAGSRTPLTIGFLNYFERNLPRVGFFAPIGGRAFPGSTLGVDRYVELVHKVFAHTTDPRNMIGMTDVEAAKMIAAGKSDDMMDAIYSAYSSYKEGRDFVVVHGPGSELGGTELDAAIAQALSSPVLLTMSGSPRMTVNDYFNLAITKRKVFEDRKVDVLGVAMNHVPRQTHALITTQLRERLEKAGLPFAGGLPEDPVMASVRLVEVQAALGAELVMGKTAPLDKDFSDVVVASQGIEELLARLETAGESPLVVTSADRLDVVLGLLAAQMSVKGPAVSGILLTDCDSMARRRYAKDAVARIFEGVEDSEAFKLAKMPVMATEKPLYEVLINLRQAALVPSIVPSSTRKINQSKALFDKHIDADQVVRGLQKASTKGAENMTPKMFQHQLKVLCLKDNQRIVLPESSDPRILTAAAEVTQRGLAKITILGDPEKVAADAKKLGLDMSGIAVVNPKTSPNLDRYVDYLVEARKKKGLTKQQAYDQVTGDINMFGTMMVALNDADGMVSGAMHTTADTIRPAMQVLRTNMLVSSIFFMCLPDKVLVYGDCAVNPSPSAEDLAQIAAVSADTAAAFGMDPRVAMLSYSTMGSGAGPDVQKVTDATAKVKSVRPDLKVEGPLQYDAAIDPKIAAAKIKKANDVAGKATCFIFPDLNTGNNTYKAVQQSTGAIAMGPVMQGLAKPVNDLSRGCTVPDIVNTVLITSIQAAGIKKRAAAAKK